MCDKTPPILIDLIYVYFFLFLGISPLYAAPSQSENTNRYKLLETRVFVNPIKKNHTKKLFQKWEENQKEFKEKNSQPHPHNNNQHASFSTPDLIPTNLLDRGGFPAILKIDTHTGKTWFLDLRFIEKKNKSGNVHVTPDFNWDVIKD